jgi:hypothetical protein
MTTATAATASVPSSQGFTIKAMLAGPGVDHDDEETEDEPLHTADRGRALKVALGIGSEDSLGSGDEATYCDRRSKESGCKGSPFQDYTCERKNRYHASSLPGLDARVVRQM